MDLLRPEDLGELLQTDDGYRLSIYLPTHRAGPDTRQDPIRLKNLLREAHERLRAAGLREPEIAEITKGAEDLIEDQPFWQHQGDGLALFCAPGWFRSLRLPLAFDELVVTNQRFHIKPLLPLLTADGRFYVLALSQNETRVLVGSRQSVQTLHLDAIPSSLSDAMKFEEPEKQLQWHTGTAGRVGNRAAIFHGHGADENVKDKILRYFRQIDDGLHEVLRNESAPLLLAGVEYYFPIYREACTYPYLLDTGLPGNPDHARPDELHGRAWEIVEPHFRDAQARAAARCEQSLAKGKATDDLIEVLSAAVQGRIDTLFVATGRTRWGRLDPATGEITLRDRDPAPDDEDLLDAAAARALGMGATVYAVPAGEVPGDGEVVALLRG